LSLTNSRMVDRGWLDRLKKHLSGEQHPILLDVLEGFERLDALAARVGAIGGGESLAKTVRWWPVVSLLGTYSSGKSTFINDLVGMKVQKDGIQAVNDKFTVLCHGPGAEAQTLPGLALAADPRFPFFNIDEKLSRVAGSTGSSVDVSTYIELKACPAPRLRGIVLVDSPGYDADTQREGILTLADQIVEVSDLVLFLFDVHKTERKVIPRTIEMVSKILQRSDASKVLYVLNRMDEVPEDDLMDVYSRWKGCLASAGLQAGDTYSFCSPTKAKDGARREEWDRDRAEVYERIGRVNRDRTYRAIAMLRDEARHLERAFAGALPAVLAARSATIVLQLLAALFTFALWAALARFGYGVSALWSVAGALLCALAVGLGSFPAARAAARWMRRGRLPAGERVQRRVYERLTAVPAIAFLRLGAFAQAWQADLEGVEREAVELTLRSNDIFIDPSGRDGAGAIAASSASA
jgi:hypothetical protein